MISVLSGNPEFAFERNLYSLFLCLLKEIDRISYRKQRRKKDEKDRGGKGVGEESGKEESVSFFFQPYLPYKSLVV